MCPCSTYFPDVFCDVCSNPINGHVYFRGDVVACRTCALHINRFGDWPNYWYAVWGIPLASLLGLLVYFVPLVPILSIVLTVLAVFTFIVSILMALPR